MITGAAPIAVHVLRFFHAIGLEVLEGYGMSENMTVTSVNRRGHARLGTVGQAVDGVAIRIAGDGEIQMRGDVVFAGYYKDPRRPPRRSSTAGCTPATSARLTPTGICASPTGRRI